MRRTGYHGQKSRHMPDKKRAMEFAREIAAKTQATGLNSISRLNEDPRVVIWESQLAIYGKSLEQAVNLALQTYQKEKLDRESPFLAELLNLWIMDKTKNKLAPMRQRSQQTLRNNATLFKKAFADLRICDLTKDKIESFLQDRGQSNQYRENLRNYLGQFLNWSIKKGYHNENPCKSIEINVERQSPKYLQVDDCRRLLELAIKNDMVGYFALCLFGGVRPEECEKLTWNNIKLDTREIFIPKEISKVKQDRQWIMNDTLFAWLRSLDRKSPLIASGWRKGKRSVIKAYGPWTADILRHTYATFAYAGDPSHNLHNLSHVMGNSPRIIGTFYKGVISQTEVSKWYGLLPDTFSREGLA